MILDKTELQASTVNLRVMSIYMQWKIERALTDNLLPIIELNAWSN